MESITEISEVNFRDLNVKIYYDPHMDKKTESMICSWSARNPKSFYNGIIYRNFETGEVTYPQGAIIPLQTQKDREIIPKFIITNCMVLSNKISSLFQIYLENEFNIRNGKTNVIVELWKTKE